MCVHIIAIVLIAEQLAIGGLEVRGFDPVAGDDAGEGDADARRAVEPSRARAAGEALAEVAGEVVAVAREDVVGSAVEVEGGAADYGVDLGRRGEREALQDLGAEGPARRLGPRPRPVHARHAAPVVAAVGVLLAVDHDARVQEGGADGPEDGGESAGLVGEGWLASVCLFICM